MNVSGNYKALRTERILVPDGDKTNELQVID